MFPFFFQVQDYLRRFESIPDMLELDHLTVSGDVTFGKNVSLKVCYDENYSSYSFIRQVSSSCPKFTIILRNTSYSVPDCL